MQKLVTLVLAAALTVGLPASSSAASSSTELPSAAEQQKLTLFKDLAMAETESAGRDAESAIWRFWFNQAPTPEARNALDAGMARREAYDFEAAENHLYEVVEAAPDYAEGYNQRAFVRFLRENFSGATDDLEKALELEPLHFGAMSGLYQVLRINNRHQAAFRVLRDAVILHPWIRERGGLPKDMWPDSYRLLHEPGLKI